MFCVECGRQFPEEDLLRIADASVCAACKPIFLQRLAEGAHIPGPKGSIWRRKKDFVIPIGAEMPDVCIRCNEPAHGYRLKRNVWWHSRWIYLLILAGILIYAIVALIVRKKAFVNIGLCGIHRKQRRNAILVSLAVAIVGIVMAITVSSDYIVLLGILMFIGGLVAIPFAARVVYATFIDTQYVRLRGAKEPFLSTLPQLPETMG
jgi:hypothetical protein